MVLGRELPDDLTADILRGLPPRSLAVSRCVCRGWRDLVDARRLLRADLLPRSVGGIFMRYFRLYSPEFLARPTTGLRPSVSGDLDFVPDGFSKVLDHCNGLLLCRDASRSHDYYVANPATRRWARLPGRPRPTLMQPQMGKTNADAVADQDQDQSRIRQIKCLVYDPTVSPYYKVFFIHSVRDHQHQRKSAIILPTGNMLAFVYSSVTGCWEERLSVPEGVVEAIADTRLSVPEGRVKETTIADTKVYWRGALYLPYQNGFLLRISISSANYRLIPTPARVEFRSYGNLSLGRSEKGVYCASEYDWHGLQIFFLNESCGQVVWELKHSVDFMTFSRKLGALNDRNDLQNGPWMLQEINYYKYLYRYYGNDKHKEVVEDKFEWNSDDDNVLSPEDTVDEHYNGYMFFLGFHPYKEIVFLDAELRRAVAYHWNTSKFQDLGNTCPKNYHDIADRFVEIETSFIYTPCWMDGGFPEEQKNS